MDRSGQLQSAEEILHELGLVATSRGPSAAFFRYLQKDATGSVMLEVRSNIPKSSPVLDVTDGTDQLSFFDLPNIA